VTKEFGDEPKRRVESRKKRHGAQRGPRSRHSGPPRRCWRFSRLGTSCHETNADVLRLCRGQLPAAEADDRICDS
jgi:hypothetical protein